MAAWRQAEKQKGASSIPHQKLCPVSSSFSRSAEEPTRPLQLNHGAPRPPRTLQTAPGSAAPGGRRFSLQIWSGSPPRLPRRSWEVY